MKARAGDSGLKPAAAAYLGAGAVWMLAALAFALAGAALRLGVGAGSAF